MPGQFASNQPAGFSNHIRNVAIVGAAGNQGSRIVDLLLKVGQHTVTAITREDSTNTFASGVQIKKINYDSEDTIIQALKGQDALIVTLNVRAPEDTMTKLIEAAAAAGVKWIIPNEWGIDTANEVLGRETFLGPPRVAEQSLIQKLGVSSWTGVVGGFWYQFSLALPGAYGFDIPNRKVTFYDDGTAKFNTSTWEQYAHAVTALMSMKILPESKNDSSPTLHTNFRNKLAYVSSFRVSQKDIFESLKRVTQTSDSDWEVNYQSSEERYNEGMAEFKTMPGAAAYMKLLYARALYPNGDGDFESKKGLASAVLGLPQDDLDECTKEAVERSMNSA